EALPQGEEGRRADRPEVRGPADAGRRPDDALPPPDRGALLLRSSRLRELPPAGPEVQRLIKAGIPPGRPVLARVLGYVGRGRRRGRGRGRGRVKADQGNPGHFAPRLYIEDRYRYTGPPPGAAPGRASALSPLETSGHV